ncbi:MAG TPA: class A beta-lactamase [Xanthomonadales bacterium]|nr:class A beta-lactamase [Xanthomonadales bacterium]
MLGSLGSLANGPAPLAAEQALAELERASSGRLGVFLLDTDSGRSTGHRSDERFGMCSTFKLLLAAAILREADAGRLQLDTFIEYGKADLVPHAPVTGANLDQGRMRIGALAEAAQLTSDNVAANLLLRVLGGPQGFTAILRQMGDAVTRIDRLEPEMNLVPAGELRDTTTPRAMAQSVARIMTGDLLSVSARDRLAAWMIATETGKKRIRAGLPAAWRAGDKTGTGVAPGMPNKHNDVAIVWPPGRAPVVIAAYFEASQHFENTRPEDDALLAQVGRIATSWIG